MSGPTGTPKILRKLHVDAQLSAGARRGPDVGEARKHSGVWVSVELPGTAHLDGARGGQEE